ncbi:MAG: hypothetical protein JWN36_2943 [Microbacteriaceae bacterium]|nr:hypothetical protein [Microbacteriaceae bacterium]
MTIWTVLAVVLAVAATIPWVFAIGARYGHLLGAVATGSVGGVVLLGTLVVSRFLALDPVIALVSIDVIALGVGLALLHQLHYPMPGRRAITVWVPALAGAVVWLATLGLAQVVPGASRLSWAMNGDTFNNLFYSGLILHRDGLALGAFENPVPLPAAIVAAVAAPGRAGLGAHAVLGHDLGAFALTWVLMLGLTGLAIGATLASAVPRSRPAVTAVVGALGSLGATTWLVGGLPVQWGYFNVHVAIPLVLASWLAFLSSRRHPFAALFGLCLTCTLLLATWTPLAVFPVALAALTAWPIRRSLRQVAGSHAIALLLALALPVLWAALVVLPTFLEQGGALETLGHGFPSTWAALAAILVVTIGLAVWRWRTDDGVVARGLATLAAGSVLIVGVLVFLGRSQADPWSGYYPTKVSWLLVVSLSTIVLSQGIRLVLTAGRNATRTALIATGVTALAVLVGAISPLDTVQATAARQPAVRILSGSVWHTGIGPSTASSPSPVPAESASCGTRATPTRRSSISGCSWRTGVTWAGTSSCASSHSMPTGRIERRARGTTPTCRTSAV